MNITRLAASTVLCAALASPGPAAAQSADDWQFGLLIYGYFPTISGTSTFPPSSSSPGVSIDADTVLDNLKFVFMGTFEARKGRWGAFTDVIYIDVGANKSDTREFSIGGSQIPVGASANLDYDLKGVLWTIAGSYRAISDPGTTLDVFAGARLVDLEQKISWQTSGNVGSIPVSGRSGNSEVSRSNWDAIVGVKGRVMFGGDRRWFVPYYLDIGAGDSDLTWQAMAGIGYSWHWGDVFAAWRYIDYDLGPGKPFSDLNLNGPLLSVAFRW
jgi:cellulase/cellobiase CelA1